MIAEHIIKTARDAGCKPVRSPECWDDVQVFATPEVLERFYNEAYRHGALAMAHEIQSAMKKKEAE
jgi:hypothetical protein